MIPQGGGGGGGAPAVRAPAVTLALQAAVAAPAPADAPSAAPLVVIPAWPGHIPAAAVSVGNAEAVGHGGPLEKGARPAGPAPRLPSAGGDQRSAAFVLAEALPLRSFPTCVPHLVLSIRLPVHITHLALQQGPLPSRLP